MLSGNPRQGETGARAAICPAGPRPIGSRGMAVWMSYPSPRRRSRSSRRSKIRMPRWCGGRSRSGGEGDQCGVRSEGRRRRAECAAAGRLWPPPKNARPGKAGRGTRGGWGHPPRKVRHGRMGYALLLRLRRRAWSESGDSPLRKADWTAKDRRLSPVASSVSSLQGIILHTGAKNDVARQRNSPRPPMQAKNMGTVPNGVPNGSSLTKPSVRRLLRVRRSGMSRPGF